MIDGIDGNFEGEMVEVELGNTGEQLPPKNDKIALIDADTVIFGSALTCQEEGELLSKELYTEKEWEDIINDPGYDEEEHIIRTLNIDMAFQHSLDKLENILNRTGCLSWELHFTGGRESFRYTQVDDKYKANRLKDKTKNPPVGLRELKDKFVEEFPDKAFMNLLYEADDTVVARKKALPEKYVLCAVDKDVLYTLPTTPDNMHFNYYSRPGGTNRFGNTMKEIKMHYIEVSEEQAMKHHYLQVLTGDPGDNVIGLFRVGPKSADKALSNCSTPKEYWNEVLRMYDSKDRSVFDSIKNMRLVNMHQVTYFPETDNYELNLWKPEGFDDETE